MSFLAEDLAPWARTAGVSGEPCRLGSSFGLLLPRYDVPPKRLREQLATAWWNRSTGKPHGTPATGAEPRAGIGRPSAPGVQR